MYFLKYIALDAYNLHQGRNMKILVGVCGAILMLSVSAYAQHPGGGAHGAPAHSVGGGHIPAHGPTPVRGRPRTPSNVHEEAGHPSAPHVHADHDQWVGHDTG
ncbi:MAG TPA: hypothetical protein VNV61_09200, partial [Steroidobacteraceae bacterium]|nr:hypothetical protein [Steroidobacteraceae bacterium]